MAKDSRLYARFALDFPDSPKIAPLSDAAFRALIEMTCLSRRLLSDGFVDERLAKKYWSPETLAELCANDPERPSVIQVDGGYNIHDFSEHQQTRADIEIKRAAGKLGGLARAHAKQTASTELAPANQMLKQNSTEPLAITETETETKTSTREAPRKRGSRVDPKFKISDEMRVWAVEAVPLVNVTVKLPEFIDYWAGVAGAKGVKDDWVATWRNGMRTQQRFAEGDKAKTQPAKANRDAWMNQ